MGSKEFVVPESLDGARLDRAAAELADGVSRARLKKAIEDGAVRVDGKWRAKGATVATGETIAIELDKIADAEAPAEPDPSAPFFVLFEGEGVLVVDKPAGLPTAPLRPGELGTLANAIAHHLPKLRGVGYGPREPGLVHRLDTETSGLVLVARSQPAFETLRDALKGDRITKEYLLVCASEGLADSGSIEFPIANHPKDQKRVYPCTHPRDVMRNSPRPAHTEYRVQSRAGEWALVRATAPRAVRHQIRAHFAAIEHPLAGDTLYGGPAVPGLARHALHASRVAFAGEGEGAGKVTPFDVRARLPDDLAALVPPEAGE